MKRIALFVLVAACKPPPPKIYEPLALEHPGHHDSGGGGATSGGAGDNGGGTSAPSAPRRHDYAIDRLAMGLAELDGTLVWTDIAGAVWMMPADGSAEIKQISEQHRDGFANHPFVAGTRMMALGKNALLEITLPKGTIAQAKITGASGQLEGAVSDGTTVFSAQFDTDAIVSVPIHGGAVKHVADVAKAVLAVHGGTLYTANYSSGEIAALPVKGGAAKKLATVATPTALAVDDTAVFVYSERDRSVVRVELASGATSVIAQKLENSDELVIAGDAIYTVSWPHDLVKLPKIAGRPAVTLVGDLFQPRGVVVDEHAVYVTSDGPPRVVSIPLSR